MGRARRFVSGFVSDFMQGFMNQQHQQEYDQYRVSSKVADMTAQDYYEYQASNQFETHVDPQVDGPFRRVGDHAANLPENVPTTEKLDPMLDNVVEMLKNLQPKANISDFVIRMARHIKSQPRKSNNAHQFRFVSDDGDDIRYFSKNHKFDDEKDETASPVINRTSEVKTSPVDRVDVSEARLFNKQQQQQKPIRPYPQTHGYSYSGPPPGLPSYNELPPADYTYYKNGVYHHVHDLRKNKKSIPVKGGGWLKFDFEDAILNVLGLGTARSAKPTVVKCSKNYIFHVILRCIQTALLG